MPQRFVGSRWRGLKSRLVFFADTNPNFQAPNMYVQTSLNPKRRSEIRRKLASWLPNFFEGSLARFDSDSRTTLTKMAQTAKSGGKARKSEKFELSQTRSKRLEQPTRPARKPCKQLRLSGTSPMCRPRRPAIKKIHTYSKNSAAMQL